MMEKFTKWFENVLFLFFIGLVHSEYKMHTGLTWEDYLEYHENILCMRFYLCIWSAA